MANIPLFKSKIDLKDFKAMNASLKTGWLTHGKNNLIFEKNFAKYIGTKYAISMNSSTSALECSLKVWEISLMLIFALANEEKILPIVPFLSISPAP